MIEGHPWETPELDALRSEQRRFLRRIPTISGLGAMDVASVPLADRPYYETVVRRSAHEMLDRARIPNNEGTDPQLLLDLIRRQGGRGRPSVVSFGDELPNEPYQWPQGQKAADLEVSLVLLLTADELATDGYRDPRLPPVGPS